MPLPGVTLMTFLKPQGFAFLGLVFTLAILAMAHTLERVADMAPCPLCLEQRGALWIGAGLCFAALMAHRFRLKIGPWPFRVGLLAAAAGFAYSAWLAGFHIGVEQGWWTSQCGGAVAPGRTASDLLGTPQTQALVACDEAAKVLGVSLATWNLAISLGLAAFVSAPFWRDRVFPKPKAPLNPAPQTVKEGASKQHADGAKPAPLPPSAPIAPSKERQTDG